MIRSLYAEFTAVSGQERTVASLVGELAVKVRAEPGNLAFDIHTKEGSPRSFFVYEVYRDQEAFSAHLAAGYGAEFNAMLAGLIEEDGSQLTLLTQL